VAEKSSAEDELTVHDLLAENCPVRFIITKAALQEGWDCPFAYVLAVLDQTTAGTALTQMIGAHSPAAACRAIPGEPGRAE
jgi:type III restriction enzyme